MVWWCVKNSVMVICFTVLAIVFKHWWIVLFAALFLSEYQEVPINRSRKETRDGETETQQKGV